METEMGLERWLFEHWNWNPFHSLARFHLLNIYVKSRERFSESFLSTEKNEWNKSRKGQSHKLPIDWTNTKRRLIEFRNENEKLNY